MAIKSVKVNINGTEHSLEYNSQNGKWEKTISAPNSTSFNLTGGYYPVAVTAENEAGTKASLNASQNDALKLVVKERVQPIITLLSPSDGAYIATSSPSIMFNAIDEEGGSGINANTIELKIDGTAVDNIEKNSIANGYECSYIPIVALTDGLHTIEINVQDNDGNTATTIKTSFTVDTIPPVLNITSPQNNLITANSDITVVGTTNDATSSPVVITIEVNGDDVGEVTVSSDGTFNKDITLIEGENTIVVTATDKASKTTSVTLKVALDTSVPVISDVSITPNPVNAGATMVVSVVVE